MDQRPPPSGVISFSLIPLAKGLSPIKFQLQWVGGRTWTCVPRGHSSPHALPHGVWWPGLRCISVVHFAHQ